MSDQTDRRGTGSGNVQSGPDPHKPRWGADDWRASFHARVRQLYPDMPAAERAEFVDRMMDSLHRDLMAIASRDVARALRVGVALIACFVLVLLVVHL